VNPKNNLAHCFCCDANTNNIDLLMLLGHEFLPAVTILEGWLEQYRRDTGVTGVDESKPSVRSS